MPIAVLSCIWPQNVRRFGGWGAKAEKIFNSNQGCLWNSQFRWEWYKYSPEFGIFQFHIVLKTVLSNLIPTFNPDGMIILGFLGLINYASFFSEAIMKDTGTDADCSKETIKLILHPSLFYFVSSKSSLHTAFLNYGECLKHFKCYNLTLIQIKLLW